MYHVAVALHQCLSRLLAAAKSDACIGLQNDGIYAHKPYGLCKAGILDVVLLACLLLHHLHRLDINTCGSPAKLHQHPIMLPASMFAV